MNNQLHYHTIICCLQTENRSYSVTPGGETFRLAVKYVLPTMLQAPIVHFFRCVEYINVYIYFFLHENISLICSVPLSRKMMRSIV